MKNEMNMGRLKGLPLALVVSLVLQGAAAVWWVSAKARDTFFLEQRVTVIETVMSRGGEVTAQMNERLARIEERVNAQMVLLGRIDKQVSVDGRQ